MSVTQTAGQAPIGGVLTPRAERWIRIGSIGTALVIAVAAMVLSYAGLHDLALDAEIHPRLALLVPVMVDGLQFVGSLGVVYSTLSGLRSWYPWTLMLLGVSISAWGNWQAAPDEVTAKLLHAAAPVILALVLEELLRVMRHKVHLHTLAAQQADAGPALVEEPSVAGPPTGADANRDQVEVADESPHPVTVPAAIREDPAPDPVAAPEARFELRVMSQPRPGPAPEQTRPEPVTAVHHGVEPPPSHPASPAEGEGTEVLPPYDEDATLPEQVEQILTAKPHITAAEIARELGKDPSYTRKTVRKVRDQLAAQRRTTQHSPAAHRPGPIPAVSPAGGTGRSDRDQSAGQDLSSVDPFAPFAGSGIR